MNRTVFDVCKEDVGDGLMYGTFDGPVDTTAVFYRPQDKKYWTLEGGQLSFEEMRQMAIKSMDEIK